MEEGKGRKGKDWSSSSKHQQKYSSIVIKKKKKRRTRSVLSPEHRQAFFQNLEWEREEIGFFSCEKSSQEAWILSFPFIVADFWIQIAADFLFRGAFITTRFSLFLLSFFLSCSGRWRVSSSASSASSSSLFLRASDYRWRPRDSGFEAQCIFASFPRSLTVSIVLAYSLLFWFFFRGCCSVSPFVIFLFCCCCYVFCRVLQSTSLLVHLQ
jgi:hypothetical protein